MLIPYLFLAGVGILITLHIADAIFQYIKKKRGAKTDDDDHSSSNRWVV